MTAVYFWFAVLVANFVFGVADFDKKMTWVSALPWFTVGVSFVNLMYALAML
jgi:hypothetical protein